MYWRWYCMCNYPSTAWSYSSAKEKARERAIAGARRHWQRHHAFGELDERWVAEEIGPVVEDPEGNEVDWYSAAR